MRVAASEDGSQYRPDQAFNAISQRLGLIGSAETIRKLQKARYLCTLQLSRHSRVARYASIDCTEERENGAPRSLR